MSNFTKNLLDVQRTISSIFVCFPRTTRFSLPHQLLTFRFNRYILSSSMLVYLHLYLYIFQCAFWNLIVPMVEMRRVELLTSCLQGRRSSQLSYTPITCYARVKNEEWRVKNYFLPLILYLKASCAFFTFNFSLLTINSNNYIFLNVLKLWTTICCPLSTFKNKQ